MGQFTVGDIRKGDFALSSSATQFVVLEAKMFSGLSSGTTRIPDYDQTARNVACMATALKAAHCQAATMSELAFAVIAPQDQISKGVFGDLVSVESIKSKVERRVRDYQGQRDEWLSKCFLPTLDAITLHLEPWEDLVKAAGNEYVEFYLKCLHYNKSVG